MNDILTNRFILPIVFPIAAGILCFILPRILDKVSAFIALVASVLTIYLVWPLFTAGTEVFEYGMWLNLRVDALSGFVLLATTIFGFLIALYSIGYMNGKERLNEYYAYLLWTIGISCGAILANEFVLLLTFWGFLGLTLYLMIGIAGPDASGAAKKSFIIIGGSDCILMLGIGIVWLMSGSTRMDIEPIAFNGTLSYIAFIFLAIAALAKAGAMPFHSWVPDCGEKAPASVAAFLPASLDKLLGIYLLARVATGIFKMNPAMNMLLVIVGAVTIIFAVMMALVQHNMKRLLSYHAVSQVGYMVLAIGTGIPIGIAGGLFHMINNVIYKSCLFLCAGAVEHKTGTSDLDKLGGLAKTMPVTFITCLVAALSISGIPPLNGFFSKWMVYQGIVEMGKNGGNLWIIWLAAAMFGSALTLASFVKVLHATFLCKASSELKEKKISETNFTMWVPMLVLAIVCIAFGVFAFRLPLKYLIFPAIGNYVEFTGTWWAGPATAMLLSAFVIGFIIYLITTIGKARECDTYIGGELLSKTYIKDTDIGKEKDIEVTGVDFYCTVQDMMPFKTIYKMAENKFFDIYDMGIKFIFCFVEELRKAHSGLLPTYLTWVIVGLIGIIAVLIGGVG